MVVEGGTGRYGRRPFVNRAQRLKIEFQKEQNGTLIAKEPVGVCGLITPGIGRSTKSPVGCARIGRWVYYGAQAVGGAAERSSFR